MPALPRRVDVLIVGGGIAGVSCAWGLTRCPGGEPRSTSEEVSVLVVDQEPVFAFHATGRSAAMFIPSYGPPPVRRLTRASRVFFDRNAHRALLTPRSMLLVAEQAQLERLEDAVANDEGLQLVGTEFALELFPLLRRENLVAGALDSSAHDIDVAELHAEYLRQCRRGGAVTATSSELTGLAPRPGGWLASFGDATVAADVVVNATGAWGDRLAALAGVEPLRLQPLRRTAFMVRADAIATDMPAVIDADEQWYVKPDSSQLLCSPADETLSDPCDARAEELDIAHAIEEINRRTLLGIKSVRTSWAGLRTFTPDRIPAVGPDPDRPDFIWSVGQGGYGIQTSPAMGLLAAAAVRAEKVEEIYGLEIDQSLYAPARFRGSA